MRVKLYIRSHGSDRQRLAAGDKHSVLQLLPVESATVETPVAGIGPDSTEGIPPKPSCSEGTESGFVLPEKPAVLFVDDDLVVRKLSMRSIQRVAPGWSTKEASNGETGLQIVEAEASDLIFMDQYMASIEKQLFGATNALRVQGCRPVSVKCRLTTEKWPFWRLALIHSCCAKRNGAPSIIAKEGRGVSY